MFILLYYGEIPESQNEKPSLNEMSLFKRFINPVLG